MSIFTGSLVKVAKRGKVLEVRGSGAAAGLVLMAVVAVLAGLFLSVSLLGGSAPEADRLVSPHMVWLFAGTGLFILHFMIFGSWRIRLDGVSMTVEHHRSWGLFSRSDQKDVSEVLDLISTPGSERQRPQMLLLFRGDLLPRTIHLPGNGEEVELFRLLSRGVLASPTFESPDREPSDFPLLEMLTDQADRKTQSHTQSIAEHALKIVKYHNRLGGHIPPDLFHIFKRSDMCEGLAPGSSAELFARCVDDACRLESGPNLLRRCVPTGTGRGQYVAFEALARLDPAAADEFVAERSLQALRFFEDSGIIDPLRAVLIIAARAGSPALPRVAAPLLEHDSPEVRRLALAALLLAAPDENSPEAGAIRRASSESRDPALRRQARTALEWLANGARMSA